MSSELWTMSPVPPAMSPLMMWPAFSTMSADRSTAFVTMSLAASIASFGLKPMAVSCVVWLVGDTRVGREAAAGAVRGPAAGQLADLPAGDGEHHRLPGGGLGRYSAAVVALAAG